MLITRLLASVTAVALTVGALATSASAAPEPGYYPPICTKSGKPVGNIQAPGLQRAVQHSPNLVECVVPV